MNNFTEIKNTNNNKQNKDQYNSSEDDTWLV